MATPCYASAVFTMRAYVRLWYLNVPSTWFGRRRSAEDCLQARTGLLYQIIQIWCRFRLIHHYDFVSPFDVAESSCHEPSTVSKCSRLVAIGEQTLDVLVVHLTLLGLLRLLHHFGSERRRRRVVDLAVAVLFRRRSRFRFSRSIIAIDSLLVPLFTLLTSTLR